MSTTAFKRFLQITIGLLALIPFSLILSQDADDLPPFSTATGNISSGTVEEWTFTAVDGEVVSLIVNGDASLDPVLTLLSETGAQLLTNDDYNYPNSTAALIQSVTIPFTGRYTIRVSGFGNTAGAYTLTRLRGYANGFKLNGFQEDETWISTTDELAIDVGNDVLSLQLAGNGIEGIALFEGASRVSDYYSHVQVRVADARPGWTVSTSVRQQSADRYYLFSINDQGLWRIILQDGDSETVLRDWANHPAIVPSDTEFNLGVLANGRAIDLFYNGSLLGQVVDDTLDSGVVGFGIRTSAALDSEISVEFSQLRITVPVQLDDETDLLPTQIILSDPAEMAQTLERRRSIPSGGELMLNIPESSALSNDVAVTRFPLGRGVTFTNFVLSTEVTIEATESGAAGCGLYMRSNDDTHYVLAYLDQTGAYGLSQRDGDQFQPGVFGTLPLDPEDETHLLIIAVQDKLRYYMNGVYVGEISAPITEGGFGNAVVNFTPNTTQCNFENIWLWNWD